LGTIDARTGKGWVYSPLMAWTPDQLLSFLDELDIPTTTVEHAPVFTVEQAKRVRGPLEGGHCKSLFLRNKKGAMWLVVLFEDTVVDLRRLGDVIGAGRVGFASPERLDHYLGVIPGAVTPFAVVNDTAREVKVALERGLLECDPLHFHPLENTRTTAISPAGLLDFLEAADHSPTLIDQDDL
jgi:Ala-tRNA(Pro) deacylase